MDLANRVVLITGAKRIGAAIAEAVAARGADVAVVYRTSAVEATDTVEAVTTLGRRGLALRADVSDPEACRGLVADVDRQLGGLDVLINMASMYRQVALDALDVRHWRAQLGVDLDGTFACTMAAIPIFRRRGGGRVINFTDWVAASSRPRYAGYSAYYVAKAAVKALTETLALELAGDNVLVNAIAPGPILAPEGTSEEESGAVERATPLGRWGGAEEVVKVALALIDTDFVTGETIRIDGGRHLK